MFYGFFSFLMFVVLDCVSLLVYLDMLHYVLLGSVYGLVRV